MDDAFDLNRFLVAQESDYERALREIQDGRKRSHWMWYIFPQISGLAYSEMSRRYAIRSASEARAYLDHPVLSQRLKACAEAALSHEGRTALEIFGSPDDLKLRSSATLFASVSPPESSFRRILEKFFEGQPDSQTIRLLESGAEGESS